MVSPLEHYYKCGRTRLWWSPYEAATCLKQPASPGPTTISTSHSISAMQPPSKAARLELPQGTGLFRQVPQVIGLFRQQGPNLFRQVLPYFVSFNDSLCVDMCVFSAPVHPSTGASDGESPSCDECEDIPLTILPSLEWEKAAVKMFKVCTHRCTYAWTHAHKRIHTTCTAPVAQEPTNSSCRACFITISSLHNDIHCDKSVNRALCIYIFIIFVSHPLLLSQHIKVFVSTPLVTSDKSQSRQKGGMNYFATFIQNIIGKCLKTRQLRNEFYCQLISLIAKHSGENSREALQVCMLV